MASYKSGFDPPTRPDEATRSRRMGTYIQAGSRSWDHREADIAHISGQTETRRGQTPVGRQLQTGLPMPRVPEPSPDPRSVSDARARRITASSFGLGKPPAKATKAAAGPELKGKSSRNVLRRKPSSIAQRSGTSRPAIERSVSSSPSQWSPTSAETRPSIEASLKAAEAYHDVFTSTRIRVSNLKQSPQIIPELDRYRPRREQHAGLVHKVGAEVPPKLATQDLPPPTPLLSGTPVYSGVSGVHNRYSGSGYSASPSTRFSESPVPGAYSRDTTPTSISSQSPGIVAPLKPTTPRLRQGSPAVTRPPVTRRRAGSSANETDGSAVDLQGLPSLRESLTSSSSNSTVKGEGRALQKKKKRLSPLPPSPPPRKSSQKFKKLPPEEQDSPSKVSQAPAKPIMTSPSGSSPSKPHTSSRTVAKATPLRPSRDGAPDLHAQLGGSMAVIQSNLTGITSYQNKRQSALPWTTSPPQPQIASGSHQSPLIPSRNPFPNPAYPVREVTPAPSNLGIVPDLRPPMPATSRGITVRTPSPNLANTKSRFGLFSRRAKTAPELPTVENKDKGQRKGPIAGTGHEGYGKYGLRPRSNSAGALSRGRDRSISAASSSQESFASTRIHDPFLLERMSPVIIAGGGEIIENRNTSSELTRSESDTSLLLGRSGMDSKGLSNRSNLSHELSRTTLWPSALPKDPAKRASTLATRKARGPADSSDDSMGQNSPSALRRSVQRLSSSTSSLPLPRPLNLVASGASPSMSSLDASIMSDESQWEMKAELERGRKAQLSKPRKLEKRPRSPRKWNFFHRSQPTPKAPVEVPMSVVVGRLPIKQVPHYAMLDSSDEQLDPDSMDLEDILLDAEVVDLSNEELDVLLFGNSKENVRRMDEVQTPPRRVVQETLLAPAPPYVMFSSPEPMDFSQELPQRELHLSKETAPVRPSRLPQVGRIPKVISARPQATSPKSFSRPFARLSTMQPLAEPSILDKESVALGPTPPRPSTPEAPLVELQLGSQPLGLGLRKDSNDSRPDNAVAHQRDFISFSPRKNSEATTSSSGGVSFAGTTAVIPEADAALEEDEVWNEYDDIIENDDTVKVPLSATSSHGVPFQYEGYESKRIRKAKVRPKESPTLSQPLKPQKSRSPPQQSIIASSNMYSADMNPRLKDSLPTVQTPTTPMSFTDFFATYGDRTDSVHGDSAKTQRHSSQVSSQKSASSSSKSRRSGLMTIAERGSNSPISQVNLRVGSMTVSKWLTFGHVLFSPARKEIVQLGGSKPHSILIVDSLGNDDWSFYAAETYPTCTFYNLSPTRPLSASQRLSTAASFPITPPNHRQIRYLSPLNKFPFPSSTFHVVVFRFPSAMSEASYRNIISESKRVLLPGGYLEMAILDLDMMNMGNRARRAVRGLKVQIQVADPGICLGSASDLCLKCVGRRGFTDVKSCKVGVPVASAITANSSGSSSSRDKSQNEDKYGQAKEEMSLADLMKDPSSAGDEGITKMVAKVGRWWYTRCYEMTVMPDGDASRSIFADESLLNECEKWNSSFQLAVAYAQKPIVTGRARGASV